MSPKKPTTDAGAENAGTEIAMLSPERRAELSLKFEATRTTLQALAAQSVSLVAVDTDDNLAAAKSARDSLRSARVAVEKAGKAARDDATKFGKAVIAKERELIAVVAGEESRLAGLIDTEVRRRENALQEAREAERQRAARINEAFAELRAMPDRAATADLERIDVLIGNAQAIANDPSGFPEDLQPAARYEAKVALEGLAKARAARVQAIADAEELAQLRREREEREAREAAERAEAEQKAPAAEPLVRPTVAEDFEDELPPGIPTPRAVVPLSQGGGPINQRRAPVAAMLPTNLMSTGERLYRLQKAARDVLVLVAAHGLSEEPAVLLLRDLVVAEENA